MPHTALATLKGKLRKNPFLISGYRRLRNLQSYARYVKERRIFKRTLSEDRGFSMLRSDRYPVLSERTATTAFDTHYIYHPAWAARVIREIHPQEHVDIGSTLSFSSMLSAFLPVTFYDIRPANLKLSGLTSRAADITQIPIPDASLPSVSCMHTVEHIGLGRYGDTLDPDGDLKAIAELRRITAEGGSLLFVVPIGGRARVCFNAHRIYSYEQVLSYFPDFKLQEFSLIPDDALVSGMIHNASQHDADSQQYGCGCFWFIKNSQS